MTSHADAANEDTNYIHRAVATSLSHLDMYRHAGHPALESIRAEAASVVELSSCRRGADCATFCGMRASDFVGERNDRQACRYQQQLYCGGEVSDQHDSCRREGSVAEVLESVAEVLESVVEVLGSADDMYSSISHPCKRVSWFEQIAFGRIEPTCRRPQLMRHIG